VARTGRLSRRRSESPKLAAKAGKNKNALVALSGQVSSRLREELEKRGLMVRDRLVPGTPQVKGSPQWLRMMLASLVRLKSNRPVDVERENLAAQIIWPEEIFCLAR
jgi:hypothetical protein